MGAPVRIVQVGPAAFELWVDGRSEGRFSSAALAREKIVSNIGDQIGSAASAGEVPELARWTAEAFDLGGTS